MRVRLRPSYPRPDLAVALRSIHARVAAWLRPRVSFGPLLDGRIVTPDVPPGTCLPLAVFACLFRFARSLKLCPVSAGRWTSPQTSRLRLPDCVALCLTSCCLLASRSRTKLRARSLTHTSATPLRPFAIHSSCAAAAVARRGSWCTGSPCRSGCGPPASRTASSTAASS